MLGVFNNGRFCFETIGWESIMSGECSLEVVEGKINKSKDDINHYLNDGPPSYATIVDVSGRDVLHPP